MRAGMAMQWSLALSLAVVEWQELMELKEPKGAQQSPMMASQ